MKRSIALLTVLFVIAIPYRAHSDEGFPWGEWVKTTLTSALTTYFLPPLAGELSAIALGLNCENYTGVAQFPLARMEWETQVELISDPQNRELQDRARLIRCLRENLLPACKGDEGGRQKIRDCVDSIMGRGKTEPPVTPPPEPEKKTPSPGEENARKLASHAREVEECLEGCRALLDRLKDLHKRLRENSKQQKDLQNKITEATNKYNKKYENSKVLILEDTRNGRVWLGGKGSGGPDLREAGWTIPPANMRELGQIKREITKLQDQLSALQTQAGDLRKQVADLEAQLMDCLKNCREKKNQCRKTSGTVREAGKQGQASEAALKALESYDAAARKMEDMYREASSLVNQGEKIWQSTSSILRWLRSYPALPWGVYVNGGTDWSRLGFLSHRSTIKAVEDFSGGLYIAPLQPGTATSTETNPAGQDLQLTPQTGDIPRDVRITAPLTAEVGKPLTLSVGDGSGNPLAGVAVATSTGGTYHSGTDGRVSIPSLTDRPGFVSVFVSGAVSLSATVRTVAARPGTSSPDAPVRVDSAPEVARVGDTYEMHGSGLDGIAGNTKITIGEETITPLAESPLSLKFTFPKGLLPGTYTVTLEEKGKEPVTFNLTYIRLFMSAGKLSLETGESTWGKVTIRGTDKPLDVEIINYTPGIATVNKKIVKVKKGGAQFSIKGLNPGQFIIGAGIIRHRR